MGLFKFILKKVLPIPDIMKYESFAFVGAHPDDIEVGCAPTVARLAALGKRICFIVATDGRYGTLDPNVKREDIVEIRKKEAAAAAKVLGVTDVRLLGFPDGGEYDIKRLKDKIAIQLAKFKPDIVFAIDNHVKSELHPDHIQTGRATELGFFTCSFPLMMQDLGVNEVASPKGIAYYYTDKPNQYIKVTKFFDKRIEALTEHKSQFLGDETMNKNFRLLCMAFKLMSIRYGLHKFCKYADAYRVLSIMHTHCNPDASEF